MQEKLVAVLLFLGSVNFACGLQSQSALPLHTEQTIVISSQSNAPIQLPARCDSNGNIYFKAYKRGQKPPIIKVDSKGEKPVNFSYQRDPELKYGTSYDFAVTPWGDLYQAVQLGKDVYLVDFAKDGSLKWKVKLDKQFWVAHMSPFNDQHFLFTGTRFPPEVGQHATETITAIFDASGATVKVLGLPGDFQLSKAKLQGSDIAHDESATKPPLPDQDAESPILFGAVETGFDGNIYVMRRMSPVRIFGVSPSGKTVHDFSIPAPEKGMLAQAIKVANGKFAVMFAEDAQESNPRTIIGVYDSETGKEVNEFTVGPEMGMVFACYTLEDFRFIGAKDGMLAVKIGKP